MINVRKANEEMRGPKIRKKEEGFKNLITANRI
jgi:hypothetical protein